MGVNQEIWVSPAAVQLQEQGPDYLDIVDDQPWSAQSGFHRGFSSSFRIRPERKLWFHFPFQLPTQVTVHRALLLWETEGDAAINWVCVHHGGMHRQHLFEPGAPLTGTPVPFDPPEQWRHFYPASHRLLSDLPIAPAIDSRFGVQLCVLAEGPGVVRFYGAGLSILAP